MLVILLLSSSQPRLKAAGCTVEHLVWHYIYMTEFLYKKLYPSEEAKTITVFDVQGETWMKGA
jgi:hypothetical protein